MKNRRRGRRYPSGDNGRDWRLRGRDNREATSAQNRQTTFHGFREEERPERPTGWGCAERFPQGASSSDAVNHQRTDVQEITRDWHDGWDVTPADNNASADLTIAWEALASSDLSDWSKPPQIESMEHWDDAGAKETWELVQAGYRPVIDPDLYLEKDIDWNSSIPLDLLACVDDRRQGRKASHPRSRSPVVLGLETLGESLGGDQIQEREKEEGSLPNQSKEKFEIGGGSGSWGAMNHNGLSRQRGSKQQLQQQVSGIKRSTLVRDDFKDRGHKRRGGREEYHRRPRFPSNYRY